MRTARVLALCVLLAGLAGPGLSLNAKPREAAPELADSQAGAAIYQSGLLPSGAALVASRADAQPVTGAQAACVNCHRRSGLGGKEARSVIPPITGQFLFGRALGNDETRLPYVPGARLERAPYTAATLARAIREGVDADGNTLSYLMPRFALNDADLTELITHLRALDRRRVPGVSSTELHFATIVAPDADPIKRAGMLEVLRQFFNDRNAAPRGPSALTMETSGNTAYAKSMFKVNRQWVLHVWQLTGPAASWRAQLEEKLAQEPVFAVISGLAGSDWTPVADFCEQEALPCLFPNVEQPPDDADSKFHSLYFTRGVLLESDLIAAVLKDALPNTGSTGVRLVYRNGDVGEAGARALVAQLRAGGVRVADHPVPRTASISAVNQAVRGLPRGDTLVLWLRPSDLAGLARMPAPTGIVYVSGVMGGLDETPLPITWRGRTHIAYPVDLPERRRVRIDYALSWFRIRRIPVVAEQVQVDTYLACGLLTETVKHLVDAFIRDYLIEQLEDTVEHRIITGYYPRLTLGPHQRFASKGGFLMHFAGDGDGARLMPDGEWMTP